MVDELRKKAVRMWKANKMVYESRARDLALDHFWDNGYHDISHRLTEMVKPKTYTGELEILALVHAIKCPIAVHYQSSPDKSTIFGDAYKDSAQTIHVLNYPDSNGSPEHYDLSVYSKKQAKAKDLLNSGSYVIIRHGK